MSNQDTRKLSGGLSSVINPTSLSTDKDEAARQNASPEVAELNRQIDEQTRFFDAILSSISDFAYTFDKEGRFRFVNQALLDLWGLKLEDAVGKNFFDLNYPDDLAARLQRQIRQVFETGQRVTDETPYSSPTGVEGYYEYIFSPFFGADGAVELVAGTTRNITERKRSEEEIKQLSRRNRDILESINDAFFAVDSDWRFTYVNLQAERLLDRKPGDLIGKIIWEEYPGLIGSEFEKAYYQAVNERVSSMVTSFYPDHSRWYEVNSYPAPNGITIYFRDVTERVRAEKALRASEQQLRAIYDGTHEYIGLLTPEGILLETNRASLEFGNCRREEVVGKPFWECIWFQYTPGAPEYVRQAVAKAVAGEFVRWETPVITPSGKTMTFDISLYPVRSEEGEVILIVPEGRDITERKRAVEACAKPTAAKTNF
jgi:PAS domain S-box-containing protein